MSDDCGSATIALQHIEGFSTFVSPHGPFYPFPPNHSNYVDISMNLVSASVSANWRIVFRWYDGAGNDIALTELPVITGTSGSTFLHYGSFSSYYPEMIQFAFAMVTPDTSMISVSWTTDIEGTVVFRDCDDSSGGGGVGGVTMPSNMVTILG